MSGHLDHLLGLHVEVYDAASGTHLMGKGKVVAIAYQPTICLQAEDGTRTHHISTLPRVEYQPQRVGDAIDGDPAQKVGPATGSPLLAALAEATLTAFVTVSAETLAAKVAATLLDYGAAPGSSLHSWRCEHPDRYGECDCVIDTAREVVAALIASGAIRPADGAGANSDG